MKVLVVGDYSNYHVALSSGLASLGDEVTIASDGSWWMNTARQIDISRRPGKLNGALLWLKLNTLYASKLRGYDVVQICNPIFVEQRPHRVRQLFDKLKRNNGRVFMSAIGTDTPYVEMCMDDSCPLEYSEYRIGKSPLPEQMTNYNSAQLWLKNPLRDHCRYIYDNLDGVITGLYEYHLAVQRVMSPDRCIYGGIPIDSATLPQIEPTIDGKINLFLGRHRDRVSGKGTDIFERVARRVVADYPDKCKLEIVENLPYNEYLKRLSTANVVLDQLYSYTPATNALLAMAMGFTTMSGGEEDFYKFIGEPSLRPIVNASPHDDSLYESMCELVNNPAQLVQRGVDGRKFVEKYNDTAVVAKRFHDFWLSKF